MHDERLDPAMHDEIEAEAPGRAPWAAMRRGFVGRCPHCGEGHIFRAYLKVQDHCEVCGEAFHHHRADDAPPYVTILVVAHVIGFAMVVVMSLWDFPMAVSVVLWCALVLAMSLTLLPRFKGALIALQWALRMHGFGGADEAPPTVAASMRRVKP